MMGNLWIIDSTSIFLFPSSPLFLHLGHCFRGWLKINLKGAKKLYFTCYLCVEFILFIPDLYKSTFSTYSFLKKHFFFCILFLLSDLPWTRSHFIDFLQLCNYYLYRHQVLCDFFSPKLWKHKNRVETYFQRGFL